MLRATGAGTWEWHPVSGEVRFGAEWLTLLDYAADELAPTLDAALALIHPDDLDRLRQRMRAHLDGRTTECDCVARVRHRDGSYQWQRVRASVIARDAQGAPLRVAGLGTRIADFGRAGDQGHPWEHVFEQTRLGLSVTSTADNRFVLVNDAFARMHGYTPEEMVGQPVTITCAPAWVPLTEDLAARVARDGFVIGDFAHRRRDGSEFPAHQEITLVRNADGQPVSRVSLVIDTTERERAIEALRRSEDRFRAAYRNAVVGMVISDGEGRPVEVNEAACRMLGYTEEEMRGMPFERLAHPDDVSESLQRRARLLDGGLVSDVIEKRYVRKDGSALWVQVSLSPIHDASGRPSHVLALIEDISSRRAAHEALREREQQLRLALEAANAGTFAFDLAHDVVQFSARCREIYGFSPEQPIHTADVIARTHPDDRATVAERFSAALASHSDYEAEYRVVAPGHPAKWLHARGRAVYSPQGEAVQMVGVKHDVTERKAAYDRLRSSEERFRLVTEATRDVLWDLDVASGRYWTSPNAAALFGREAAPSYALSLWEDAMHPGDRARVAGSMQQALRGTGTIWEAEYRFRLAGGAYGEFIDRAHIVRDDGGRAVRMVGAMTDVTEVKRAHRSLLEAHDRLRAAGREVHLAESRERAALARELHDEFGQLLTAAKLNASWLKAHAPTAPGLPVESYREKATNLCDVLDTALHGVRHVASQLRPPALDQLGLSRALEGLAAQVERHAGFECVVTIDDSTRAAVFGPAEGAAIYRIVQELLTNAARHAGAGHVRLAVTTSADRLTITVEDDGRGFEPSAITGGWGLKGIRERAELLDGAVAIDSRRDGGTTVHVTLPRGGGA
ncbi:MAG: PAS domain S-box protein [Vicinamibacterales bacterium]